MNLMRSTKLKVKTDKGLERRRYFAQQKAELKSKQDYQDGKEFHDMSVIRRYEDSIMFVSSRRRNLAEAIYPDKRKDKYVTLWELNSSGVRRAYKFDSKNCYEMDLEAYPILDENNHVKYFFSGTWGGRKCLIDYQAMMIPEPKNYARYLLRRLYSKKSSELFSDFGMNNPYIREIVSKALVEYESFIPSVKSTRSFIIASLCEKLRTFPYSSNVRDSSNFRGKPGFVDRGIIGLPFNDRIDIAVFVHCHNRLVNYGAMNNYNHPRNTMKTYSKLRDYSWIDRAKVNAVSRDDTAIEEKKIMLEKAMKISKLAAYVLVKANFNSMEVIYLLNEVNSEKRRSRKIWEQRAEEYFASNPNIFGGKRKAKITVGKVKTWKKRISQENGSSSYSGRV